MESFILITLASFGAVVVIAKMVLSMSDVPSARRAAICAVGVAVLVTVCGLGLLLLSFRSPGDGRLRVIPILFAMSSGCVIVGSAAGAFSVILAHWWRKRRHE